MLSHNVLVALMLSVCRLYAYEGVGMLLGQEDLAAEEQHAYVAALLQPLIHQVCAAPLKKLNPALLLVASNTCSDGNLLPRVLFELLCSASHHIAADNLKHCSNLHTWHKIVNCWLLVFVT